MPDIDSINIITPIAVVITFVYSTFATKANMKDYVDEKHKGVMHILKDIKHHLSTIEERLWDQHNKEDK